MRRTPLAALTAIATAILGAPDRSFGITIDSFEEGAFSLAGITSGMSATQSGLSMANVISGERSVFLQPGGGGTATAELTLSSGDDAFELMFDAFSQGQMTLSLDYVLQSSVVDLTSLDRFVVDLTQAMGSIDFIRIQIDNGFSDPDPNDRFGFLQEAVSGPGQIVFPFADFNLDPMGLGPVDLAQIDRISLLMRAEPPSSGGTFQISNFEAVPEPSTALLFGAGLAALASRRRQ